MTSLRRKRAVNLLIAAFAVGSAVSVITQRELWPFSPYPMFATLQARELVLLEIVGLSARDSEEIPLAPSRRTSILTGSRYRTALDRLVENGSESEIQAYLANAAHRYEAARSSRQPPLGVVRLYKSRWQAVPQEQPPARRVERTLLAELVLSH